MRSNLEEKVFIVISALVCENSRGFGRLEKVSLVCRDIELKSRRGIGRINLFGAGNCFQQRAETSFKH